MRLSLRAGHHRVEALCIQVKIVDLVPPRLKAIDDLPMNRCGEAIGQGVGKDHVHTHLVEPSP